MGCGRARRSWPSEGLEGGWGAAVDRRWGADWRGRGGEAALAPPAAGGGGRRYGRRRRRGRRSERRLGGRRSRRRKKRKRAGPSFPCAYATCAARPREAALSGIEEVPEGGSEINQACAAWPVKHSERACLSCQAWAIICGPKAGLRFPFRTVPLKTIL
jgi:hypothetical protein